MFQLFFYALEYDSYLAFVKFKNQKVCLSESQFIIIHMDLV